MTNSQSYKITDLEILYESQPQIKLGHIGSGLNVVFGSNESGKSRIKEFIEWMIFAKSPQFTSLSSQAKKSSFNSINQISRGLMTVSNRYESITITQKTNGNNTDTSISGHNISTDDLAHMLSDDISLAHFRNVFSLDLDALSREQSNQLLSEDKLAEVFLSAAQTGSGVSLSALVFELKARKEELFSESGNATKRQINRLIKEITEIDKEIRRIRREQQTSLSYTSDIEALGHQHRDLKSKLNALTEELANLTLTKNYAQPYERYNVLLAQETTPINTELVGEIVNTRELLSQCEHHEGDERLLNQLLIERSELSDSIQANRATLEQTLNPDDASQELNSHSFLTDLEKEKQESARFTQEQARNQQAFDDDNDELVRLTNRVDDLTNQIEKLKEAIQTVNVSAALANPTENKKINGRKALFSLTTIAIGLLVISISFLSRQPIGFASGLILCVFGIAVQLVKTTEQSPAPVPEVRSLETLEIANISREIDGLYSEIKHKENQIEKHVKALKDLEKMRTLTKQAFANKIVSLGFESSLDPIHIELYINDLERFRVQERHFTDIESRSEALSTWFESFFDAIAKLQQKTVGTTCETNTQITAISHARTWLESVLELSIEHRDLEKILHETESETRTIEKSLVAQFSSMENASAHFKKYLPFDIEERITNTITRRRELEEKLSELDQEIGSIRKAAEHAGQETQLQDQLMLRESLIRELEEAHQQYVIAFTAHKYAEIAFEQCQRESQPEVLQKASGFLSKTTNGKWNLITIDLLESSRSKNRDVEMKVSSDLETLEVSHLSKGTQEQLYLSLRLALMATSTRGRHIPALFDDVAVNSDRARFSSIAPIISEVARSRQVFYFTCHEWVRDELATFENATVLNIG